MGVEVYPWVEVYYLCRWGYRWVEVYCRWGLRCIVSGDTLGGGVLSLSVGVSLGGGVLSLGVFLGGGLTTAYLIK